MCFHGATVSGVSRILAVSLGLLLACDRKPPEPDRPASIDPPKASAAPSAAVAATPYRFPAPPRLIAIGDLHGDLAAARAALRLAGAIGGSDEWIGKDLVVVQTGDQIDRGDDDRAVLDLFTALAAQARARGGRVHALNGNHETLNVELDFRYVTPGAYAPFADLAASAPISVLTRFEPAVRGRVAAFRPGGPYARRLSERNTIAIVGETVFVHGGVLPEHVRYDLGRINAEISGWMRGETSAAPASVRDQNAPIWTRAYGEPAPGEGACSLLREALDALRARRMVIGHTVQEAGINAACGGAVWRIDVGMSSFYRSGRVEVLAIEGDRASVLRAGAAPPKR
jgi:hypothetical protein